MEEVAIRLVVGLGNPGERYAGTRHNVGFRAVDGFAASAGAEWSRAASGEGLSAKLELPRGVLWAAKPHTYMNASGSMVSSLARFYKVDPRSVAVVSDDIHLPLGRIRIRRSGSAGGQKGLESILSALGTLEVPRLRLGVGPLPAGMDAAAFVLGRFRAEERELVERMLERSVLALRELCDKGLGPAMNAFNAKEADAP